MKAVKGEKGIVEPTYVYLPGVPGGEAIAKETGVDYFSVPVELGVCAEILSTYCPLLRPFAKQRLALRSRESQQHSFRDQ